MQDVDQSQNGTFSSSSDESVVSAYKTATNFREVSGGKGGGLHAKKSPRSTSPPTAIGGSRTQRNSCLWLLEVERPLSEWRLPDFAAWQ